MCMIGHFVHLSAAFAELIPSPAIKFPLNNTWNIFIFPIQVHTTARRMHLKWVSFPRSIRLHNLNVGSSWRHYATTHLFSLALLPFFTLNDWRLSNKMADMTTKWVTYFSPIFMRLKMRVIIFFFRPMTEYLNQTIIFRAIYFCWRTPVPSELTIV